MASENKWLEEFSKLWAGSLKLLMVGVFSPQKLANVTNWGLFSGELVYQNTNGQTFQGL